MRNGNGISRAAIIETYLGFEPTYEEWKPAYVVMTYFHRQTSFEPTYEEWKQLPAYHHF